MTFIVTLIALVIERFFDWSHIRKWQWYVKFSETMLQKLPGKGAAILLAAQVVPLLVAVLLVDLLLTGWIYNFPKLLFQLVVLLFCLGPQNFGADAFAAINALTQGDSKLAAEKLKTTFGIVDVSSPPAQHASLLKQIFIESERRVFGVVFWYVILGPVGAVLYRLLSLTTSAHATQSVPPDVSQMAEKILAMLDWLPDRLLSFVFALGGEFVRVLDVWRHKALLGLTSNQLLLVDAGFAGIGADEATPVPLDGSMERNALSLLDRTFIIALVIIAALVLII